MDSQGSTHQKRRFCGSSCAPSTGQRTGFCLLPSLITPPDPAEQSQLVWFGDVDGKEVGDRSEAMNPIECVEDNYFWMRDDDRSSKEVLEHIRQENAYTNYKTAGIRKNVQNIYKEMLSHVQETDSSVPIPHGDFLYYTRTMKGASYKLHYRKSALPNETTAEEMLLDENALAKGRKHCSVGMVEVSPDHSVLAYAVDFTGNEKYTIFFKGIATGELFKADTIDETTGNFCWSADNTTVYYVTMDVAHRADRVMCRLMRSSIDRSGRVRATEEDVAPSDQCLYTENDKSFSLSIHKSLSGRFLFINCFASTTSEVRYIDLDEETDNGRGKRLHLVARRNKNVLYYATHACDDRLLIMTNDGAQNFKVMEASVGNKKRKWKLFFSLDGTCSITSVTSFAYFTVVEGREDGLSAIWIIPQHNAKEKYKLEFFERVCKVGLSSNKNFNSQKLRVWFSSMTTPTQVWDIDLFKRERVLLKSRQVPNYDHTNYGSDRIEAESPDGTMVPITLVWNKRAVRPNNEPNLLHMYGYGSYQISIDPVFNPSLLPLLDRGVVYAIAHVRGGGEFGRQWYEKARFETKHRTFDDFVACAEHLIYTGRTKENMMSIEGRSAGGMLVGAAINMRPHFFRACLAAVPFVDCLNTMSDASIPLTTGEWLEWGNPHQRKYFDAIRSYCPYQNICYNAYPAVLATTGLHDPRVLYSEPAKWVAKLRDNSNSGNDILLKVDMNSGHYSASDRYSYLKKRAFELAWLLKELEAPAKKVSF